MAKTYSKAKGRRENGAFHAIPVSVLNHANFNNLGAHAVKLLMQMVGKLRYARFGGTRNNGDLSAAWSDMKALGWKSKQTIENAKKELLYYGFLMITRQGGRHVPTLYAITWLAIDDCNGKLDVRATSTAPSNWKELKPAGGWKQERAAKCAPSKTKTVPRKSDSIDPIIRSIGDKSQPIDLIVRSIDGVYGPPIDPIIRPLLRSTMGGSAGAACGRGATQPGGCADGASDAAEDCEERVLFPAEVPSRIRS